MCVPRVGEAQVPARLLTPVRLGGPASPVAAEVPNMARVSSRVSTPRIGAPEACVVTGPSITTPQGEASVRAVGIRPSRIGVYEARPRRVTGPSSAVTAGKVT